MLNLQGFFIIVATGTISLENVIIQESVFERVQKDGEGKSCICNMGI